MSASTAVPSRAAIAALEYYCDLHANDLYALRNPAAAHAATRHALRGDLLLDERDRLTERGRALLARAEAILAGTWQAPPPLVTGAPGALWPARVPRAPAGRYGVDNTDYRALRWLAAEPGAAWRAFRAVFSTAQITDMQCRGLIAGEARRGCAWTVTPLGLEVLQAIAAARGLAGPGGIQVHQADPATSGAQGNPVTAAEPATAARWALGH